MATKKNIFSYSWFLDEKEENVTSIRVYGIDKKNKNICLRIENFTPWCYIELPDFIEWNRNRAKILESKIQSLMREKKPDKAILTFRKKLYGANLDKFYKRKKYPYLLLSFFHPKDRQILSWRLKKPLNIVGLGSNLQFKVHELEASPILQLVSHRKIPTTGWFNFVGKKVKPHDQITLADEEYKVKWKDLAPLETPDNTVASPLVMGFDIEVFSTNPNRMPQAKRDGDACFQISCVFYRFGDDKSAQEKYLLSLGQPNKIKDVKVIAFKSEGHLLEGFADLINSKNPNIITGYNILSFDIPYLIERAKLKQCIFDFAVQGFHKTNMAEEKTISWSSSAYKNQEFEYLDAEGRVIIDLLPLVRRDHKLDHYKLNTVAEHLLKNKKDDLDVQGIFRCYREGIVKDQNGKYTSKARKSMATVGKYCVMDSVLTVDLFQTLQTWIGLCEMAKTCNVQIFTLYTQGQQIKVYSQVYKYCMFHNTVVESNAYQCGEKERYVGAYVVKPVSGMYEMVIPFDFASLYPTTIIAYNIDYSTWVKDERIPDSLCNVMEWEDHQGCEHDPKVKRRKILTSYIETERNNIKKIREKIKKSNVTKFTKVGIPLKKARKLRDLEHKKLKKEIKLKEKILKPYVVERSELVKSKPKHIMCEKRKYRFLKKPKGVIPTILQNLLDARANTRKERKEYLKSDNITEEIKTLTDVLDKRQLAYKISCNSMYGAMGVRRGYLPFMPGAMCTCYMGRKNIKLAAKLLVDEHQAELVYGDSVTGDTPVMIKHANGMVDVVTIETLANGDYEPYDQFKAGQSNRREKQQAQVDVRVWADGVWADVNRVIRHKTKKRIFRVLTHTGCVDVTEDHSLLDAAGRKLKPVDAKIGQELLHAFPTEFCSDCKEISRKEAFAMGFFFGDGNLEYLEKYRPLFYDKDKRKKVPMCILNAPVDVRSEFVRGYRVADGTKTGPQRTDCKGKIGCQGLYYLFCSLGENVSINTRENVFRLNSTRHKFTKSPTAIKKIIDLGYNDEDEFVYDIETTQGRFFGGIGRLILKNTDSAYALFPAIKQEDFSSFAEYARKVWDNSLEVASRITEVYPSPMKLEFEMEMYTKFLILSKKRYMYIKCKRDGKEEDRVGKKGVLLARRDNSKFVRDIYEETVKMAFDKKKKEDIIYFVMRRVNKMCSNCLPPEDFRITKSIGSLGNRSIYDPESDNPRSIPAEKGMLGDYKVSILTPENIESKLKLKKCTGKLGDLQIRCAWMNSIPSPIEQEYYLKCLPAPVILAEKMRRRGMRVDAGERLAYVVCLQPSHKSPQFEKLESFNYYCSNSQYLKIDHLYYLKLLANPLDEVLKTYCGVKNLILNQYKLRVLRQKLFSELKKIFEPKIIFK